MITVMMLAHHGHQMVEVVVQSFRLLSDMDISFIIVDKGSGDELREWASGQTDLTYVLIEEESAGWGKAINMAKRELHIETDLLIMEDKYMLTPQCLRRLEASLHAEEDIGGVCGVFSEEGSYEKAVAEAEEKSGGKNSRTMALHYGAVLWKKEALEEIGEFEEKVESLFMVVKDYCLRMIEADKPLQICLGAVFWNIRGRKGEVCGKQWEEEILERKWGMHYFNNHYNERIISLMEAGPEESIAVLEIGCDCGATLLEIKNRYPKAEVYGIELNARAASMASHFAQVAVNNIESRNLPFDRKMFDYIIFGDVLEHLNDPEETLKYCKDYLREEGMIIASVPNVMHISVMEQLMQGNFTYMENGLLDKTHIHFFTCNEIIRTLDSAGYEICRIDRVEIPINDRQKYLIDSLLAIDNTAQRFMYETYQYVIKAKKLAEPRQQVEGRVYYGNKIEAKPGLV